MNNRFISWAGACLLLLTGCSSYKVGAVHDPGFKTIYIENFKSDVEEPGLENLVTTTVIQQFQRDGTLRVTDVAQADVVLRARIDSFEMSPVRYSRANELTPTEATMTIGVHYSLTRRGEKEPYDKASAAGTTSFFIGSDLQSDKRQGVPLAAERLGRNIVSNIADAW